MHSEKNGEILRRFGIRNFTLEEAPADYNGPVFIWDIDNTYLVTNLDSWKEMLKIPFESARDKVNVSGTAALLRTLQGLSDEGRLQPAPLYFISASPPQLRNVLEKKMKMDGLKPYGMIFKDNMRFIRRGRFSLVKNQVAFKLVALAHLRFETVASGTFHLFGDDTESDPFIYSLFGRVCDGIVSRREFSDILSENGLKQDEIPDVVDFVFDRVEMSNDSGSPMNDGEDEEETVSASETVGKCYINLASGAEPSQYIRFGPRIVPVRDSFQMSLALFEDGLLDAEGILEVAAELKNRYGFMPYRFAASLMDSRDRGYPGNGLTADILPRLAASGFVPEEFRLALPVKHLLRCAWHRHKLKSAKRQSGNRRGEAGGPENSISFFESGHPRAGKHTDGK